MNTKPTIRRHTGRTHKNRQGHDKATQSHFYSGIRDQGKASPGDVFGAKGALPSENESSGSSTRGEGKTPHELGPSAGQMDAERGPVPPPRLGEL